MKSICGVEGVRAAGIKEGKFGLTLIEAAGTAAGVFTSNLVRAPPISLMEDRIRKGRLEAIIANSGCANAYTGERGGARTRFDVKTPAAVPAASIRVSPNFPS
ncbi:MAG: ornithine acetyltransferase, partial [Methanoregulaceae archaeon]|nr:ornithine acetyltransferase [Methanoregulaceae archaeon]